MSKDKNNILEVSIMIDDNNDVKTKLAEAAADAIMESAAKRAEESEAMEKAIDDCLAQMNELKKKVGDYRRKIGRNRKYVLYNAQRQFFDGVVKRLGYKSKIEACKSPADFRKVCDEMLSRIS